MSMRRWCARLAGAAAGLLLVLSPGAVALAGPNAEAKAGAGEAPAAQSAEVDPRLTGNRAGGEDVAFWVVLRGQADLSGAARLRDKAAKAAHVRRTLIAHAERSQAGLRRLLAARGAKVEPFWIANTLRVTGDATLVGELAGRPEVSHLLADRQIALPPVTEGTARASVAAVEWNVARIRADRVWNEFGVRGEGVVVAGVDSGVQYDHPALVGSYRGRRANGTFDHNYNWYTPLSFYCPTAAPCDPYEHGTHTMGTIVGRDAAGTHQTGVAPGAKWIAAAGCPIRFCSPQTLLSAGQWIVAPTDLNGQNPRPDLAPDVVNNSWGESGFNPIWQPMVASWVSAGIFPVFANGNSGPACASSGSPGYYSQSYSVGSLDDTNLVSSFSSRGPGENGDVKPDVTAPGQNVQSTLPNGQYGFRSGTSMAAPHVAGTVALLWSAAPALDGDIAATRAALDNTAIDVNDTTCGGSADDNNVYGEGRLDAYAAVAAAPRANLGVVHGQFTSAAGGQPLNDVTVTLDGPLHRVAVSGMDGTYRFDRLLPGTYSFTLDKWGYQSTSGTVTVAAGQWVWLARSLTEVPSATISGVVRTTQASPAGAVVTVTGTPLTPVTVAANGSYRFRVPLGEYDLAVAMPGNRCTATGTRHVVATADVTAELTLPDRTDQFGYSCVEGTGGHATASQALPLTGNDAVTQVTLPFAFPLYGTAYPTAWVTTNGTIGFLGPDTQASNTFLPVSAEPNGALYPFWDDLVVDGSAGVYVTATATSVVFEWRDVTFAEQPSVRVSFSATLRPDGSVTYGYSGVGADQYERGWSATVGLEDQSGTDGLAYSALQEGLTDGRTVTFRP